jgi:hypothetical protein
MSARSSTPGTPAEEVASSAVDEEESGAPEQAGTSSRKKSKKERKREKRNKNKNKGEKSSPHPPSWETVCNADNSTIQDHNPPVIDIPSAEGEGELVEKVASDEEDAPVMVDKVGSSGEDSVVKVERPQAEAGKTAGGDSGTDGCVVN